MQTELLNMGLAFLEGLGLIISPCILPILPIILSGSLTGSKKRPLGIIFGFVVIFALFTFFSRKLVQYTGIDLGLVRHISYFLLILFGMVMLSTYLTEKFNIAAQRLTRVGANWQMLNDPQGGFISGILFGSLVAIIWTPCAGPILAAVIVQTVLQKTTFTSFLTILFFGMGAAVPMLIIALFGRGIMEKVGFFKTHAMLIRKILGAIIILVVADMIYSEGLTVSFARSASDQQNIVVNGVMVPYPAPAFAGITDWINSQPLQINQLKGKVVLIDFWTYSCINCVRTLPYLKDWYNKYHNKGLVIIGVHTPEFEFEKTVSNVQNAVTHDGIRYPIALDNQYATWNNYQNSYWPAHYLIDKNGYVVYQHFGEGEYEVTENNIRYLLGMTATNAPAKLGQETFYDNQTPETYLGYARAENFSSLQEVAKNQVGQYTFPAELADNKWALQGAWTVQTDKVISAEAGAAIKLHFNASKVYIVMGNAGNKPIKVQLLLNGELLVNEKGKDVVNSSIDVNRNTLYEVVELQHFNSGILQLTVSTPGLEVYTFTFGG